MTCAPEDGQLPLAIGVTSAKKAVPKGADLAAEDPVAIVRVDTGLPHLDRPFEYLVPHKLADQAVPGARVRVRFAGKDAPGYVIARASTATHSGRLAPLRTVVSSEPVLSPASLHLADALASHYAGTVEDILRLAIPPRHAAAEKALAATAEPPNVMAPADAGPWQHYPAGAALLRRIQAGERPAASWLCAPGAPNAADPDDPRDWASCLAALAHHTLAAGRGVVIVLPDLDDVRTLDAALTSRLGKGAHVSLTADQGAQARYTAWLKALRGHVRCVIGTRASAYAPLEDVGLFACWDDGDDALTEPRSPYPHTREVLRLRAEQVGAALVVGGYTRSVAVQQWVETGVVRAVDPGPEIPRPAIVQVAGEDYDIERDGPAARAHIPASAWRAAKKGLIEGPVLIQVPRRGYLPAISCQTCRQPSRCQSCRGPLALPARAAQPVCRWCGTAAAQVSCPNCGDERIRSTVVGASRTAEEIGRAFPGVPVLQSSAGEARPEVGSAPTLVIATPGAEPRARDGYAATLLLDAWAMLDRPALDAASEAFRRWMAAAALTRSRVDGGTIVLCGAPAHTTIPAVEALVRSAPAWFAERELADRQELGQPPTAWMATITGSSSAVQRFLDTTDLAGEAEVLGPMPVMRQRAAQEGPADVQALVRASWSSGPTVARALHDARSKRSARKETGSLQVRVDPHPSLL